MVNGVNISSRVFACIAIVLVVAIIVSLVIVQKTPEVAAVVVDMQK